MKRLPLIAVAASFALGLVAASAPASARLLDSGRTCASREGGRKFCPMPTKHGVHIKKQLSDRRCIKGKTWFARNRGVEVRNGCRAVFMPNRANRPHTALR